MASVLHGDADLLKLAIRHYDVAAELRPEAPWILRNLGLAHASLEQWEQAVQAYRKALALAPDSSCSERNLCLISMTCVLSFTGLVIEPRKVLSLGS